MWDRCLRRHDCEGIVKYRFLYFDYNSVQTMQISSRLWRRCRFSVWLLLFVRRTGMTKEEIYVGGISATKPCRNFLERWKTLLKPTEWCYSILLVCDKYTIIIFPVRTHGRLLPAICYWPCAGGEPWCVQTERVKCGPADLRTGGRVNCGPSLRTRSAFYACVGTGKTLYSERLMPRNYGGTLTGEDVICISCINDTNHDTMIHEQCDVLLSLNVQ